nr:hypothetical protein [Tersicoccus phoenicis]
MDAGLGALLHRADAAWPLKSVSVNPGFAALTLIGVPASSFAYWAVSMLTAALDEGYCADAGIPLSGVTPTREFAGSARTWGSLMCPFGR